MKKALIILLSLFSIVCCTKEEPRVQLDQPAGYKELYAAYKAGKSYISIVNDGVNTVITMDDKSTVSLLVSEIAVHDCTGSQPAVTATNSEGEWMLGGKPLGIWFEQEVADADAVPVYIYYLKEELHVFLSNGGHFVLKYKDPELLGEIPKIYLTTKNNARITSKENYVDGTLKIVDKDRKYLQEGEFEAPMKIRGRGNSTWGMPKKPYKIKLESKARLFDMSTDKEWCLLANYADKSLIRNITAMEISRICQMSWTPRMISCEVYLNGNYNGVYNFCEHKKVSSERVNINVNGGDILFEIDESQDEPVSWTTKIGTPLMFSEPSEPTSEQIYSAKKHVSDLESALTGQKFDKVYELLDRDSFINAYIVQELTKNIDGNFRKSSYLTLPKNGKLCYYFVWDFDLSLGNADYYGNPPGKGPDGWWVKEYGSWGRKYTWYWYLFKDPEFVAAVKARWNELYPQLKDVEKYIDKQYRIIGDEAIARNFKIWSFTDNQWWNASRRIKTYPDELKALKEFYTKRLEWLNTNINAL